MIHGAQLTTVLAVYSGEGPLEDLARRFPEVRFHFSSRPEEQRRLLAECEVLLCSGRAFSSEVAEACRQSPSLRWIQMCSAGVEHVLEFEIPSHIRICRGGGLWNRPVAEHALSMMLALARRLPEAERERQEGIWDYPAAARRIDSLEGKRLLVLGFGEIGLTLAKGARSLGMEVFGLARRPRSVDGFRVHGGAELDRILPHAEVVAITLPGGANTRHKMGATQFALLPAGALLINVGRGTVVDTGALVRALREGHLGGAGLDVTDPEPCPRDHPLWSLSNVIITPHVGGDTRRWPEKVAALMERNLKRYLAGEPLEYEVARERQP